MRAFLLVLAMLSGLISGEPLATSPTASTRGGTTTATVVSGTVTDAATGTPLMGAQSHVGGLTLSALAASDGGYRLTIPGAAGVPGTAGSEIVIRADLIGYVSLAKQVSLGAQSLRLDFALQIAGPVESADDRDAGAANRGIREVDAESLRTRADVVSVPPPILRSIGNASADPQQVKLRQTAWLCWSGTTTVASTPPGYLVHS